MKPRLSYTIWFSQRTGSTLLCKALEATRIAGRPNELLQNPDLLASYPRARATDLQEHLWVTGSTANGIFALKHSFCEPRFSQILEIFHSFPNSPRDEHNRPAIWESVFPHHRHIFMTRRNKARLAVSWWKAIKTEEWHRLSGVSPRPVDLTDAYSFDAIHHLYCECSMREAGIQEFFSEGDIIPFTIVYEDFVKEYEKTVRKTLQFLGLDASDTKILPPALAQTADVISEEWVQRFREELQQGWTNRGW
jgi:trehalose 2-sulfotransferase